MLYTLLKFLGWGALLAFIGGCIGWALRALKCRTEVARAKALTIDAVEVDRMRHRLANLEQVVAERDRLRIQLADVRHTDSPGIVANGVPVTGGGADGTGIDGPGASETAAVATIDNEPTEVDDDGDGADAGQDETAVSGGSADLEHDLELDLDAAAVVIGKKVSLDDLTVVEGIGPKISELCKGIGVITWRNLADIDVADLQSMLDAAGSRYAIHKPGSWPHQAELLATGRWEAFKTFTDDLGRGT